MSRTARAIAASAALMFSLHMVSLQGQHKSGKPAPAPHAAKTTTAKAQTPKPTTSKAAAGKHATTKQQAPKVAKTAKPAASKAEKDKKNTASVKKASSTKKADTEKTKKSVSAKKSESTKKTDDAAKTATTTTTTPPLENLSPVQQKLAKNTSLQSKLQSRLPAGTNMMEAADGFRNLGQFVAAVNVSNNLNIPFDKLKADMVTKKMSLGQAIQDLRPATSSATVEAQHAEYDANTLVAQTEQETSVAVSAKVTTQTTTAMPPTTTAKPRKSSRKTLTGGA